MTQLLWHWPLLKKLTKLLYKLKKRKDNISEECFNDDIEVIELNNEINVLKYEILLDEKTYSRRVKIIIRKKRNN